MKRILLSLLVLLCLTTSPSSAAIITFNVDNTLDSFTVSVNDGSTTSVSSYSSGGAYLSDWQQTTAYSFNYDPSNSYTFIWSISNSGGSSTNATTGTNPMAFIGVADLGGTTLLSGLNEYWSITGSDGSTYSILYNDTDSRWYLNQPSGIDTALDGASWLGVTGAETMQVTLTLQAVPIPGAAWLMGAGLAGIFGLRRKIRF